MGLKEVSDFSTWFPPLPPHAGAPVRLLSGCWAVLHNVLLSSIPLPRNGFWPPSGMEFARMPGLAAAALSGPERPRQTLCCGFESLIMTADQ